MSVANDSSEAWIRDYAADANTDLMRKRPRVDDDDDIDTSPLSSTESVVVQEVEPATLGTSFDNAIELCDDSTMDDLFTVPFTLFPGNMSPFEQLERLLRRIDSGQYIEPSAIHGLSIWINDHLYTTTGEWRSLYLSELEFLSHLAHVLLRMLSREEDIIDPDVTHPTAVKLREAVEMLYVNLTKLCIRVIQCLPTIIKSTISRRDSASASVSRQPVYLLRWVIVLAHVAAYRDAQTPNAFQMTLGFQPVQAADANRRNLGQNPVAKAALIDLFQRLVHVHAQIANSWEALDSLLRLFQSDDLGLGDQLELVLDIAQTRILPVICEKHPKALPESFHESFVNSIVNLIRNFALNSGIEKASAAYQRLVKCDDDDAVPTEPQEDCSITASLASSTHMQQEETAELVATAWALQALKRFIFSDIMDVRSQGINQLSVRLVGLHSRYHVTHDQNEHPILQYIARFMRVNEITKYIFGPNSHASLVNHSQHIIGFLAAVGAYTTLETDIIWHACTTSVEAEFVRASFGVLISLYRWLDMDHLQFVAQKYTTTPTSKIGRDAFDSLLHLLKRMMDIAVKSCQQSDRLATPLTSIKILRHVKNSSEDPCIDQLEVSLMTELMNFAKIEATKDDLGQIYAVCVLDIVNRTNSATTSLEILNLFLRIHPMTAQLLESKLPVHVLLSELAHFVDRISVAPNHSKNAALPAIRIRIEAMIRLLSAQVTSLAASDEQTIKSFYDHIVGDKAISNDGRDAAWATLISLAHYENIGTVAVSVTHDFVVDRAITLPADKITPHLVDLWNQELTEAIRTEAKKDVRTDLLLMPLWQKLVDTAEGPTYPQSRRIAVEHICAVLFQGTLRSTPKISDIAYDAEFTRQQIDRLCSQYHTYCESKLDEDYAKLLRAIELLDKILQNSRNAPSPREDEKSSTIDLRNGTGNDDDVYSLYLNVLCESVKQVELRVPRDMTFDGLARRLYEITGATGYEIKVAGKIVDLQQEGNRVMADAFPQIPMILDISPNLPSSGNAPEFLAIPSRVEQEILAHFDRLKSFLNGPEQMAEKMYNFLSGVRPPSSIRNHYASSNVTVDDLFPSSHIWQSIYSCFVLQSHLLDFFANGETDERFLKQAVHLLVQFLTDKNRPVRPGLHIRAMKCLLAFIEGLPRPCPDGGITPTIERDLLVDNPTTFASRMIEFCMDATQMPEDPHSTRTEIAVCALKCLFVLSRRQGSVWAAFTRDSRFTDLHMELLLCNGPPLSQHVASLIVKNFCNNPNAPDGAVTLYLNLLLDILPRAVHYGYNAVDYFAIITDIVSINEEIREDEGKARTLTKEVITHLWKYNHSESVDMPLSDPVILGLLKLLVVVLEVLKTHGKPLDQQGLSKMIFDRFLFPPLKDSRSRPLVDQKVRQLAYNLVMTTCESKEDLMEVLYAALKPLTGATHDPAASYPGRPGWLRPAWKCSGLANLGMTCYMNSLLQQLFANTHLRKFIFGIEIVDESKQSLLVEVQKLFGYMQNDYNLQAETRELAYILGIQIENQEDVHGFYEDFISRLEASMPDEASKLNLCRFFTGKLISQIKGECGHVSPMSEPFLDLSIVVRNKSSLQDSLNEFVQGEPMEGTNKYRCQACDPAGGGRLVNAMKRACLEELPDNMTFCLKRFTFEAMAGLEGKVNDRFEFPQTIDLSRYLRVHLENPLAETAPDVFELVGVIVHQGTLAMGHYWSYTLLQSPPDPSCRTWMRLEDGIVTPVDSIAEIQQESMGGQILSNGNVRADNAYVLFYQRKSVLDGKIDGVLAPSFDPGSRRPLPPKFAIPAHIDSETHNANDWRHRIAHMFDEDFAVLTAWLMQCLHGLVSPTDEDEGANSGSRSPKPEKKLTERLTDDELMEKVSELVVKYTFWVALCDSKSSEKMKVPLDVLSAMLAIRPNIAHHVLKLVLPNSKCFAAIMRHTSEAAREDLSKFILACLSCLRRLDSNAYNTVLVDMQQAIRTFMNSTVEIHNFKWSTYFTFISSLARMGTQETKAILDTNMLCWAFDTLSLLHCKEPKRELKMQESLQSNPERVSALYNFIEAMLSGHVDLSRTENSHGLHTVGDKGVVLKSSERKYLSEIIDGRYRWLWQSRYAEITANWRDFAPGKLLALIMRTKPLSAFLHRLEQCMIIHNTNEETNLPAILALTLWYAAGCSNDQEATKVVNALAKTFREWDDSAEILMFMQEAYELVPWAVVQCINLNDWFVHYLWYKPRKVQQQTRDWLQRCVFSPTPISDYLALDTCRVRQTRTLITCGAVQIEEAYGKETAKMKYENLVGVLHSAASYLREFQAAYRALKMEAEESGGDVAKELSTEFVESEAALGRLTDCLEFVNEWASDDGFAVSSPMDRVRRSVETASEEAETSEEDEDGEHWTEIPERGR